MPNTAHIYNPKDDSLPERIRAYRAARRAWMNVEASLKYADDPEWSGTLGDRLEIEEAYEICTRSLQMASEAISQDDIEKARQQELLDRDEIMELIQGKRLNEMKEDRNGQEDGDLYSNRRSR